MRTFKRYIITASCLAIFAFVLFIACRKTKEPAGATPAAFSAAEAKEFYYGVFRKSVEYAAYDRDRYGIKSPDWKHGIYQRKSNIEMVEFPLLKVKGRLLIPSPDSLSWADLGRIAAATLTRIVFIKTAGKIVVRELEYIPELPYLKDKNFDISSNTFAKLDENFTGRIIQRYWDGKELSRRLMVNGQIKRLGRIRPVTVNDSSAITQASSRGRNCSVYEICEWERDCEYVWVGDMLEKVCHPWMQTGNCWIEEYCEGDDDPCQGMNEEQCNCAFYGNCNEPVQEPEKTCAQLLSDIYSTGTALNEKESVNDCGSTGTTRYKCYLWKIYTASGGLIPLVYKSSDKATQVRMLNKAWKFVKLEHIDIIKQGTEIGWTSSISSVTATPSISSSYGVDNIGNMHLLFTVKYEMKCATGEMVNYYDTKTAKNSWHVDE